MACNRSTPVLLREVETGEFPEARGQAVLVCMIEKPQRDLVLNKAEG